MKKRSFNLALIILVSSLFLFSCENLNTKQENLGTSELNVRQLADTIGFTQYSWQMDSIIARIDIEDKTATEHVSKMAICPHDDYAYAGGLYAKTLEGIKAKTVILIGVTHKARIFNLENKLVFGSFDTWKASYGNCAISPLRDKLLHILPQESFMVHDSMMQLEHSLEAITPFLQNKNKEVEIIPILVPYFTFENMELISDQLAKAIHRLMLEKHLEYGKEVAIVISSDAIHYGDVDWGSDKMAPFGVDSIGTAKVMQKEMEIINTCLIGELNQGKIKQLSQYLVQDENYKEYKWTWCGRYALPFGLMFANDLNDLINHKPLNGTLIDYRSSLHNPHIEVNDIGMGTTADAHQRHWVGYVGVVYK